MPTWILVSIVVFVAGSAVIAALFTEDGPFRHPGLDDEPDEPVRPSDLRRVTFRTAFRGYDPVAVDRWLVAAADAWDALADTAGPDLVALAEQHFLGEDDVDDTSWLEADLPDGAVDETPAT